MSSSEQGFQSFVEKLREPTYSLRILREYPVLARQVMIITEQWEHTCVEFVERLCADWADIRALFCPEQAPGKLTIFHAGAGDKHRDGHSVHVLGFASGFKLVYKPRSLAVDQHFQKLLLWLNERGDFPPFQTLRVLERGTHGWIEFAEAAGCESEAQLERFYQRQGAYLALLYALQAVDFHHENLIACGEHPILIDLESLFHTLSGGMGVRESGLEQLVGHAMMHSVLSIGLLPQRIWGNEDINGIDLSGMGGHGGQLTPDKVPTYEDVGTASMHFVRKRVVMPGNPNRPTLNGQGVVVQDYAEFVVRGFNAVYSLLLNHRDDLLAQDGILAGFAHGEIRMIARPTRIYGLMLYESFHPDLMRNALDRDRFFDRLWMATKDRPFLKHLINAERRDLWEADIPIFTTYPNSRDLWTSDQERIKNFSDQSGLDRVRDHIHKLDEDDLARQTWFIRASFATLSMGVGSSQWHKYQPVEKNVGTSAHDLLAAAQGIGDRLNILSLKGEDAASWIGLALVNERTWMLLPLGLDLYNGLPGIVLFLAYLGDVMGEPRYTALAEAGLATIQNMLTPSFISILPLGGAFDGRGGLIYLFTHLSILWQRADLLDRAESLVDSLVPQIEKDTALDIIGGAAGTLASLLVLYEYRPTPTVLESARACGQHLVDHASRMEHGLGWMTPMCEDQPLAGFSHGAAGIAWVLSKLTAVTGDTVFLDTARQSLEYERSLFSEEKNNWPDLRDMDLEHYVDDPVLLEKLKQEYAEDEAQFMHAWCHGAPGIGISRVGMLPYLQDEIISDELDAAIRSTLDEGFGLNHSVCHGDLGNLEFLLLASQRYNPALHDVVYQKAASILDSINQHGWLCGVPNGVETPSLMTGLAGIGYELLRLSRPERVPSLLLLDPPQRR
jgi:type 2 lantibiotic biosynthesis protein LanM